MDYPIWEVPYLGGSLVIAMIAIIHVFIAHFAVGAGIYNACTETFSLRHNNSILRQCFPSELSTNAAIHLSPTQPGPHLLLVSTHSGAAQMCNDFTNALRTIISASQTDVNPFVDNVLVDIPRKRE